MKIRNLLVVALILNAGIKIKQLCSKCIEKFPRWATVRDYSPPRIYHEKEGLDALGQIHVQNIHINGLISNLP